MKQSKTRESNSEELSKDRQSNWNAKSTSTSSFLEKEETLALLLNDAVLLATEYSNLL